MGSQAGRGTNASAPHPLYEAQIIILYIHPDHAGPPPRPTMVIVNLDGDLLRVEWDFPSTVRVTLNFTVILRTAVEERAEVMGNQSYTFPITNQTNCQKFRVEIIASNIAGANETLLDGVIPAFPEDICHEISQQDNKINLTVTFKVC